MSRSDPAPIDIDEDQAFQRRSWQVERVGWCVLGLVSIAALCGLFGAGPLSEARVAFPEGHGALEYDRVVRHEAATKVRITLATHPGARDTRRISVSQQYLDGTSVESVLPPPRWVEAADGRLQYLFAAREAPVTIVFNLRPNAMGLRHAAIAIDETPPVAFTQLVLP